MKIYKKLINYTFFGLQKLFLDLLYTKIFYPKCRLIRRPFYIRGKKYIRFGNKFTTGVGCRIDAFNLISKNKVLIRIGDNVQINDHVHIASINSVVIKNNVLIASNVYISDHNHGFYGYDGKHTDPLIAPINRDLQNADVIIENDVWIGQNVCILPGTHIGKGVIIGANAVVTKNIENYHIVAGNPAVVIKYYDFENKRWKRKN